MPPLSIWNNDDEHQNENTQIEQVEEEGTKAYRKRPNTTSQPTRDRCTWIHRLMLRPWTSNPHQADWKARIKLLTLSFGLSAIYVRINCNHQVSYSWVTIRQICS